jgi:GNAT superfamily N-acetyltransferase
LRHAGDVIEVRDAVIDDADALATAHIDSWRGAYRGLVPDEYLDAEAFASTRRDGWRAWTWQSDFGGQLFVATIHERVVGFGHAGPEMPGSAATTPAVTETAPRRGEIYGFYLHPTAWGSGAAGALMSRCEEFLRDEGFTTAILWAPRDHPRARAFYEKAGWHATGEESTFSPPDPPEAALPPINVVVTQYEVRL